MFETILNGRGTHPGTTRMVLVTALLGTTLAVAYAQTPATRNSDRTGGGMQGARPQLELLRMPAGFKIDVYAAAVQGARSMALAPDGTLFVGTRGNKLYAVVDANTDHVAEKVIELSTSLRTPNGLAFKDGSLFVGELNRIVRFDHVLEAVKAGTGSGLAPKVVLDGLPSEFMHGWKYIAFGPDGYLYYQVGAPCNICDRGDPFAAIWRVKPDGTGNEVFARGVRNSVGMAWHPATKELWFTDNGRDTLGDEQPNDELNHAARAGLHFGYPYCHEGAIADPEFGANHPCSNYAGPSQKLGPHVAALGLKFYTGAMFPPEYRNRLLIAQHGSWNRTAQAGPIGYRIMMATIDGGRVVKYEPFAEGFLQGRQAWGRPVDLLEMPDGSLLVSDDTAGAIYRITYAK
ncbi:MAG TPA: PQQ-dependent sugar dehydrogenase [Vicinamibacterales bacterium]|nr:PQQ-dependent sugar dehydrogenase [Vicinamibacterales bacterium]